MRQGVIPIIAAVLIAVASSRESSGGEALLPDDRLGVRSAPLLLLSRPDVRADVGLDATRAAEAEEVLRTLHGRARELRGMKGDAAVAARRAIDEEQRRWLQTHLSEEQRKRLVQVDLQWEGSSAVVSRPAVADALGLTPEQRGILKRSVDDFRLRRDSGQAGVVEESALTREVLNVLSEPQKGLWKAMLGRPFVPRLATAPPATGARKSRAE